MSSQNAMDLIRNGVTAFRIFSDDKETALFREAFQRAQSEFPEFQHTPDAAQVPFVMGGFGAYGNPSSFHNGYIRTLRLVTAPIMTAFFRHVATALDQANPLEDRDGFPRAAENADGQWFLEHLFDRMCRRPAGSAISAESAHRDLNPQTAIPTAETVELRGRGGETKTVTKYVPRPWDYCFGGWINLDASGMQYFSAVEKSHADDIAMTKGRSESGFDTHEPLRGRVTQYDVPPGYAVVFFQRIQHIVTPTKQSNDSYRQFRCYRLFKSTLSTPAPLNGEDEWARSIGQFAVPRLPSGQIPPLYGRNHMSMFLLKGGKNDPTVWSARKILPRMMENKTVRGGEKAGRTYAIAPRFMASLQSYGLADHYPPYKPIESQLLRPTRLFLSDTGTQTSTSTVTVSHTLDVENIVSLRWV